jgi:site-specific recombinase XerD
LSLENLSKEQLETIGKLVITQRLTRQMDTAVNLAEIDLQIELSVFLSSCGRVGSKHTQRAYKTALLRLQNWCALHNLKLLALTPKQADEYALSLKDAGLAPNSIRLNISAISSFFEAEVRWHETLHNPFHGTKLKPLGQPKKIIEIPSNDEVERMLTVASPELKAILSCMIFRGLRASGVATLHLRGNHFTAYSKGKMIQGLLPGEAITAVKQAQAGYD